MRLELCTRGCQSQAKQYGERVRAPSVIRQPEIAPHDVFQQANRRTFEETHNHLPENVADSGKPVIRRTNVTVRQSVSRVRTMGVATDLRPMSSSRIFWMMNVATVLDNSLPLSMIRKQRGMISVCKRKLMTSESSICAAIRPQPRKEEHAIPSQGHQ